MEKAELNSESRSASEPLISIRLANKKGGKLMSMSRRDLVAAVPPLAASIISGRSPLRAAEKDESFDFSRPLQGWEVVSGKWSIEDVPGALSGKALVQHATQSDFNVIVAPTASHAGVDVHVRFKPISGREDASAGIVFRFADGHYYVIRANALEDNFNFYYYDHGRHQIAGAHVKAPALGHWHRLRVTAEQDHIKGWLNDQLLIEHDDRRFKSGRIGLWTKADSVTAFDDLVIKPLNAD